MSSVNQSIGLSSKLPVPTQLCENIGNVIVTRPTDTPNNGWNNSNVLGNDPFNSDVVMNFTIAASVPNTAQMIGLNSDPNTNSSYQTIDYAMYILDSGSGPRIYVYENGTYRGIFFNPASVGDSLSIRRVGNTVEYLRNGTVFYTSTVNSSGDLYADSSFYYAAGFWGTGSITFSGVEVCPI